MTRSNARFPKATAVAFALLMLAPAFPGAIAEHTTGQAPGVPTLPHAKPGECIALGGVPIEVARALAAAQNQDPTYLAQDKDTPVLCGIEGQRVPEYVEAIRRLDAELERVRNLTKEIQRQADERFEQLYPDGSTASRVVLLDEKFNGRRDTGIGGWYTVTDQGATSQYYTNATTGFEGPTSPWRFGTEEGYARGHREFLVSPELDMRTIRGNDDAYDLLNGVINLAGVNACQVTIQDDGQEQASACALVDQVFDIIGQFGGFIPPLPVNNPLYSLAAVYGDAFNALRPASLTDLTLTYRYNFADSQDGVRVWAYAGDAPPDRATLFSPVLGLHGTAPSCDSAGVCTADRNGGVLLNIPNARQVSALQGTASVSSVGLTGRSDGSVTVKLDMSEFAGKRVWLMFEAATKADKFSGGNFFQDNFRNEPSGYGFEVSQLHLEGAAWPRNIRVHEMLKPEIVSYPGEGTKILKGRLVLPPGNEPFVVPLHNAGIYKENVTLRILIEESNATATRTVGSIGPLAVKEIRPGEVRELSFPWPAAVKKDLRYTVTASITVDEFPNTPGNATDPSRTNVRIPNYANFTNNVASVATILSTERHHIKIENVQKPGSAPLDLCSEAPVDGKCTTVFADKRGAPRYLQLAVINDGNVADDITATLVVTLDGIEQPEVILNEPIRKLIDLRPLERRVIGWQLGLNDPGVYKAAVHFTYPNGSAAGESVSRLVYVQQTTGLVCFDNLDDYRACGPTFNAMQPFELLDLDVTAATYGADGRLYAFTNVSETQGWLAIREPDTGDWTRAQSISNASLLKLPAAARVGLPTTGAGSIRSLTFSPTGTLYAVGDNGTAIARSSLGVTTLLPFENRTRDEGTNLLSSAWFNNTLHAVGADGHLYQLNLSSSKLEQANISFQGLRWTNFTSVAANGTHLYGGGLNGTILYTNGGNWTNTTSAEKLSPSGGECSAALRAANACGRNITAMGFHEGAAYAVGEAGLILKATNETRFGIVRPVEVVGPQPTFTRMLSTQLGGLFIISANDRVFACEPCGAPANHQWRNPVLSLPFIAGADGKPVTAALTSVSTGSAGTAIFAKGGVILEHLDISPYGNLGDWTTAPPLVPTFGGAIETRPGRNLEAPYRGTPASTEQTDLTRTVVVTLHHHVAEAAPGRVAELRFINASFPTAVVRSDLGNLNNVSQTCFASANPTLQRPRACDHFIGAVVETFDTPTRRTDAGQNWAEVKKTVTFNNPFVFSSLALEFMAGPQVSWAVDDVTVETLDGRLLLSYFGPSAPSCTVELRTRCNLGTWREPTAAADILTYGVGQWVPRFEEALDQDTTSAWHITRSLVDRPVWVANDEVFPNAPGEGSARLRDNWNSRLVTPAIDLTNAYDPVLTFNHLYAFRTQIIDTQHNQQHDGGFVEVQWTLDRDGCRRADAPASCWSEFVRIFPLGGYPSAADLGLPNKPINSLENKNPPEITGPVPQEYTTKATSYWGRIAHPDEQGIVRDVAQTSKYVEARFNLSGDRLRDGVPEQPNLQNVNLSGRFIKVGFHVVTGHTDTRESNANNKFNHTNTGENTIKFPVSFDREGWYLTDVKVLGASRLGVDLKASDLRLDVGYDAGRVGVGPGTRVPVSVTVSHNGVFDALGFEADLEIRRVIDPVLGRTTLVERISLGQQPRMEPGEFRNLTFAWDVPRLENASYVLAATITPIGVASDEDPTDNVARLASLASPLKARTTREYHVAFGVTPENATSDITRSIAISIVNTGNVPISDIRVSRRILQTPSDVVNPILDCRLWENAKRPLPMVDCREWVTDREAPAGTKSTLQSLDDEFSPVDDLFWKAPRRASYYALVNAEATKIGLRSAPADTTIRAFATFLFDDVERGPIGEATTGQWAFDPEWNTTSPGFRSKETYTFGDIELGRYLPNKDSVAVTPVIDLSNARSARFAFYHRYNFEQGYDAGVVEATADGGLTWQRLTPVGAAYLPAQWDSSLEWAPCSSGAGRTAVPSQPVVSAPKATASGAGSGSTCGWTPVAAASKIHPTSNPNDYFFGYTGDSSEIDGAVDGWVLSQLDLTGFPGITLQDVPYEQFPAEGLDNAKFGAQVLNGRTTYLADSWKVGRVADFSYWEVMNLTENRVRSVAGNSSFWWSGSATLDDDGTRPQRNTYLNVPVDLTGIDPNGGDIVEIDWWEWMDRTALHNQYLPPATTTFLESSSGVRGAFTWNPNGVTSTFRLNVTKPAIVERDGQWYHMVAKLDEKYIGQKFNVTFIYAPIHEIAPVKPIARYADDPGFAIDGFTVRSHRVINGETTKPVIIVNDTTAWAGSSVTECNDKMPSTPTSLDIPCLNVAGFSSKLRAVAPGSDTWRIVQTLPNLNTSWQLVTLRDAQGRTTTPTGEPIQAFYSGNIGCTYSAVACENQLTRATCPDSCLRPLAESRLVTPAVDLGIVAGDSVDFTFAHRYAFYQEAKGEAPIGSGGVIEVQVRDPLTGAWGPWQQLYSRPTANDLRPGTPTTLLPSSANARFGYPAYTSNDTRSGGADIYRLDPPFEPKLNTTLRASKDYMFYYSGNSTALSPTGWVDEQYDMSEYLGRTVRFGFHMWNSGHPRSSQNICQTDGPGTPCQAGWWIRNVQLTGAVLAGAPVQLRFHAATDGNVENGLWQLDDLALYGSRYGRNVGVFVNTTPDTYGALNGTTTLVPIEVRNLGSTVRRDLAVEIRELGGNPTPLTYAGSLTGSGLDSANPSIFRIPGVTLGPGQTQKLTLSVTTPDDVSADGPKHLLVILREFNPAANAYVRITDNEVKGFLETQLSFTIARKGAVTIGDTELIPAAPEIGELVRYTVPVKNSGYGPITVNVTCDAATIGEHSRTNHNLEQIPTFTPAAKYACTLASGTQSSTIIPAGQTARLTFQATPTVKGTLRFDVKPVTFDGRQEQANLKNVTGSIPVSMPKVVFRENFTAALDTSRTSDMLLNWTAGNGPASEGSQGPEASRERGREELGSLVLGFPDGTAPQGGAGTSYIAQTPIIDLRNLTSGAFLSFWHLDRMANNDGATVKLQILMDERSPVRSESWSPPYEPGTGDCVATPEGGFEGVVRSYQQNTPPGNTEPPTDLNPGHPTPPVGVVSASEPKFFITPNGQFENDWKYEVIDLSKVKCRISVGGVATDITALGHQVRFVFVHYQGPAIEGSAIPRGNTQGFYIDDVTVSPMRLSVTPQRQEAVLLDATSKQFNLLVHNSGAGPDLVNITFDAANSSAPADAFAVPKEPVLVQANETKVVPIQISLPRDPSLLPTVYEARIQARSIFDANAAGDSTFRLAFSPRQWADLSVRAEAPKVTQEGTETFIPIVVENNGLVASVDTTVVVTDTWMQGGERKTKVYPPIALPSMASFFQNGGESSTVVEFRWQPEKGSLGPHTLTISVDPLGIGEEYTRTDNILRLDANVIKLLVPDLSVEDEGALILRNAQGSPVTGLRDGEALRYEVTAGEIVSFDVKVRNLGAGGVTNVAVNAYIGQLSLPAKSIPYLAPGGEVTLRFNWLAQKGDYPIEVSVRSEQAEPNVANNRHPARGVVLMTVKGYEVGVLIDALEGIIDPGHEVPITFRLSNTGNAGEEIRLAAELPKGWAIRFQRDEMFLRSQETLETSATVTLPKDAVGGEQFIKLLAISRENSMKAAASSTTIDVRSFYEGRLASLGARGAPPSFILPVTVFNDGNSLEPWSVNVRLPAGWTTTTTLPAQWVVPAQSMATFDLAVTMPAGTPPGPREIDIVATLADGKVRTVTAQVDVMLRRVAKLTLDEAAPGETRGAISYPVTVENVGNVNAPFRVLLVDVPAGAEARLEPSNFTIAPGTKTQARLIVTPSAALSSGAYGLTGYAVFEGVHPDSSDGQSNYQDFAVQVARPDLRLISVEHAPRADVKPGERVVVKAAVSNLGAVRVADLPVHLYADDVFIAETRIASLAPGETREVVLNWTALPGEHALSVVIDPYRDTIDASREDNTVSLLANVAKGLPLGQAAAERVNVPAPGFAGLVVAFAAALAVAAVFGRRRPAK